MNLDEAQQQKVISWIEQGLQPADIQKRLVDELGVRMTYMEVRFLLADLNLKPKDKEVAPAAAAASAPSPGPQAAGTPADDDLVPDDAANSRAGGSVSVSVDQLTRAGAIVSGKVTFSDGKQADWYLDQMGRLGLAPKEKGYRPPQSDLMEFQAALQDHLAKLGY